MRAKRIQAWRELLPDVRAEVERLTRGGDVGDTDRWHRAADVLQAMGEPAAVVEPRDYVVKSSGEFYLYWLDEAAHPPWFDEVEGWCTTSSGERYVWRRRQREAARCTYTEALARRDLIRSGGGAFFAPRLVRLRSVAVILAGDLEELEDWRRRLGNVDDELPFGSGPQEVEQHIALYEEIARRAIDVAAAPHVPARRTALQQALARADLWDMATTKPTAKARRLMKGGE